MNPALIPLDALQQVDSAIARVEREFRALDSGAAEKAEYERRRDEHGAAAAALQAIERDRRDAELELAAVEQKKREHEQKLYSGSVRNPKELDAMQHEIEALGRNRSRLDGLILELMERGDEQSRIVDELHAAVETARTAYEAKARVYAERARALRKELARLQRARAERVADVPPAALKRYEAIRAAKHGVGLARIFEGRCVGCNTSLPKNTVSAVRDTEAMVTCESCGRLLYEPSHGAEHRA